MLGTLSKCEHMPERLLSRLIGIICLSLVVVACESSSPVRNLPPSESDLVLLKPGTLCQRKSDFLLVHPQSGLKAKVWGSGEELVIAADRSLTRGDESYFFDEDGTLVGALYNFSSGLDLAPYSVLRHTLTLLKPTLEFYLNVANFSASSNTTSAFLYETGDEKTTTQYLVLGARDHLALLQATVTIDPYVRLFSPYRREFLDRLRRTDGHKAGQVVDSQGAEDKEPFPSLQQFARGQTAQLAYCGTQEYEIAADAYHKSILTGFSNKVWLSEAHHKYGQSLLGLGKFEQAKAEILQSLAIRPNTPEILNNLGSVQQKLGEKTAALDSFEKAISLRPNYAIARFNFAEAIESTNPRRAITEYETYLALVEGVPDEADRIAVAKQRLKELKHNK